MKQLTGNQMSVIEGGLSNTTNSAILGFCAVGSFLNPAVAVGCTVWGIGNFSGWWWPIITAEGIVISFGCKL